MLRNNKFGFTGEGSSYFGILLANGFLCLFTLGIYIPWAIVKEMKFLRANTTFSGKPFSYTGEGKDIFKGFLVFLAAMAVLIISMKISPILGLIVYLALLVGGIPYLVHSALTYDANHTHWNGKTFEYTGDLMEYIKLFAVNFGLMMVTIGIYGAWAKVTLTKYIMQHIKLGKLTFDFEGDGTKLFMIMLKGGFLTMITLGIYGFWFVKELNVYSTNNMVVNQDGRKCNFNSNLQVGDVFNMIFVGGLIVMFTFGIGFAWVAVRNMKILLGAVDIADELDPENI
jgi:uncharacterized membrane protein YjgN (DUF898 family)